MKKRRNHSAAFKAQVALAALSSNKTLTELSEQFGVHASQIAQWKTQLQEKAGDVFAAAAKGPSVKELHAEIGRLAMENAFLAIAFNSVSPTISFKNKPTVSVKP